MIKNCCNLTEIDDCISMKIAYVTLLFFVLFVAYSVLTEHTRSIRILHQDNIVALQILDDVSRNTELLAKAMKQVPTPMPVTESTPYDPKMAQRPDNMPVRKPEIVE